MALPYTPFDANTASSTKDDSNSLFARAMRACSGAMRMLRAATEVTVLCGSPQRLRERARAADGHGARYGPSPFERASCLSRVYFMWATPLVALAATDDASGPTTTVQLDDLWPAHAAISSAGAGAELEVRWAEEHARAAVAGVPPRLEKALWRMVRYDMLRTFMFKMGWLLFALISNALLLSALVDFLAAGPTAPASRGYALAAGFLVSEGLRSACVNQHWLTAVLAGVRLRAGARALLYAKAVRLRGGAAGGGGGGAEQQRPQNGDGGAAATAAATAASLATVGATVNLLTNDAQRLLEAASYGEFLLSTPPTLIACLGIMWAVLGPAAIAGFTLLLLAVPLQARLGTLVASLRRRTVRATDERAKLMSEVLGGVMLIKLAAWEAPIAARVAEVRGREVELLTRAALVRAVNTAVVAAAPSLVLLAAFGARVMITGGEALPPSAAFVCVALFNVARFPLGLVPQAVRNVADARVAAARLQTFYGLPEVGPDDAPVPLPLRYADAPASSPAALIAAPRSSTVVAVDVEGSKRALLNTTSASASQVSAALDAAAEQEAATAARLQALCGDATVPPDDVILEARHATFVWPGQQAPPTPVGSAAQPDGGSSRNLVTSVSMATDTGSVGAHAPGRIADMSFSVRAGELVAIVGPVGCGKSTLFAAILGQLERVSGCFATRGGSAAFAAQTPWIFNASLRENILLGDVAPAGSPAAARYAAALDACCLHPDIAALPAGDAQEIGERGINLSGGQRARVALARALYSTAPLLLLDDPLSAVDAHVCAALWRNAIRGPLGAGGGRAVVLVTHQTHYAVRADRVLVLAAGGTMQAWGTPGELAAAGIAIHASGGIDAEEKEHDAGVDDGADAPVAGDGTDDNTTPSPSPSSPSPVAVEADIVAVSQQMVPSIGPVAAVESAADVVVAVAAPVPSPGATTSHRIIAAEERAKGAVSSATLRTYVGAGGGTLAAVALTLSLLLSKGAVAISSAFVAYWTARPPPPPEVADEVQQGYLASLFAATVAAVIVTQLIAGAAWGIVTLRASRVLHNAVFASVMRATPAWFTSQPAGRILARFTADLDGVDTALPAALEQSAEYLVACGLAVVLMVAVTPWFALAALPIIAAFVAVARLFRRAARELKRLDALARSPLVSHVSATAAGLVTLRAYGRAGAYATRFAELSDDSTRTFWALYAANRWVAVRLDWTTAVAASASAALIVAARDVLTPGLGGLALSSALALAGVLQFATRLTSEAEAALTGVERLAHYTSEAAVPHERVTSGGPPLADDSPAITAVVASAAADGAADARLRDQGRGSGGNRVVATGSSGSTASPARASNSRRVCCESLSSSSEAALVFPPWYSAAWSPALVAARWPRHGALVFSHVTVRHRADLPPALTDVSFSVPAGARVGVVGRTGAGKSTLLAALFRMLELDASGSITLDGVDLARVNVYHVRSCLAAIPQDPTLFRGTLRSNLDPFSVHSDDALWAALRGAGAEGLAAEDTRGLGRTVAEGGANLSVGQRQLLCLARALLRGARVIAMDESTAATDGSTDANVQAAIRRTTVGATLLIVAHRLATIADADRVLVLGAGRVLEFDTPAALLGIGPRLCSDGDDAARREGCGAFAALVDEAGPSTAAALRRVAAAHEAARVAADSLRARPASHH